ncbi:MAG: hypothetical protein ACR2GY_02415 [Phycisphaerales bacterium]
MNEYHESSSSKVFSPGGLSPERLSAEGRARRDAMLVDLLDALDHTVAHRARSRKRNATLLAGSAAVLIAAVGMITAALTRNASPSSSQQQFVQEVTAPVIPTEPGIEKQAFRIEVCSIDPAAALRRATSRAQKPSSVHIEIIHSDDALLAALYEADQADVGLLRSGERIRITGLRLQPVSAQ